MLRCWAGLVGFLLPCAALAQPPAPSTYHASYETYAVGIMVAEVDSGFGFGPESYRLNLGYHTTGVAALFARGHQFDSVSGSWKGEQAVPDRFVGKGRWHGDDRVVEMDYPHGQPVIRQLVPPTLAEREPVPRSLQANSIDALSALAELIHVVKDTGRCETTVRTYDGWRAVEIEAHTVGEQTLAPTSRFSFAGKTLRCDFSGRLVAGFKLGDDRTLAQKPMHGSAWLASVVPGAPPLPVRITFESRWFGDTTMYLTGLGPGSNLKLAQGNELE